MKQESVKNVLLLLAGAFVYSVGTQYFMSARVRPASSSHFPLIFTNWSPPSAIKKPHERITPVVVYPFVRLLPTLFFLL